jgi:hypothetical protein
MRLNLSARDRRALTIAAAATAAMLTWTLGLSPFLDSVAHARERLDATRDMVARERQLLAEAGSFQELWQAAAALLLETAPRLFGGDSDGAAGAAFAGYLQAMAKQERVFLLQLEPLPTAAATGGLTALGVRLRGESDLEGMLRFLDDIEAGPKLVRVTQLQIDRASGRPGGADAGVLTFQLTAVSYALAGPRPGDSGEPRRQRQERS